MADGFGKTLTIDVILVSELTRFCDQWEMEFFHETQFWDIGNLLIYRAMVATRDLL
jgi:hypothetical protein